MAEAIALVIGIVDPLFHRIQQLKDRIVSYRELHSKLVGTEEKFSALRRDLDHVKALLEKGNVNLRKEIEANISSTCAELQTELRNLTSTVDDLYDIVSPSSASSSSARLKQRLYRFTRADKITRKLEEVLQSSDKAAVSASLITTQVNILFGKETSEQLTPDNPVFQKFSPAISVPPLPENIVIDLSTKVNSITGRLTLEQELKHRVLAFSTPHTMKDSDDRSQSETFMSVTGVSGMGGIGKTVALIAIGNDKEVQKTFTDGVYFIQLGQCATDRTVISRLAFVVRITRGRNEAAEIESATSLSEAAEQTAQRFRGKTCLFLCDDIWGTHTASKSYVDVLKRVIHLAKSSGSCMVFTSRDRKIAERASSCPIVFSPREPEGLQARKILLARANEVCIGGEFGPLCYEAHEKGICALLRSCAGVPLTLAIVGCGLSSLRPAKTSWKATIESYLDLLASGNQMFDVEIDDYPGTLTDAIGTSLALAEDFDQNPLLPGQRRRPRPCVAELFTRLCVFTKQYLISFPLLHRLWTELSEDQVRLLQHRLLSLSLIMRSGEASDLRIRLHDHVVDFCETGATVAGNFPQIHAAFLDAFIPRDSESVSPHTRAWWEYPWCESDLYVFQNLARLLSLAGHVHELVGVVSHAAWARLRVRKGGVSCIVEDFNTCIDAVHESERGKSSSMKAALSCIRDAVIDMSPFMLNDRFLKRSEAHARLFHLRDAHGLVERFIESGGDGGMRCWLRAVNSARSRPHGESEVSVHPHVRVSSITVNWDEKCVTLGGDALCTTIDLASRQLIDQVELPLHECLAIHPSSHVVLLKAPNRLYAYDYKARVEMWTADSRGDLSGASWSSDGSTIVIGGLIDECSDCPLVLDASTGIRRVTHGGQRNGFLVFLAVNSNGTTVVSASQEPHIRVLDAVANRSIWTHQPLCGTINDVCVSDSGSCFVTATDTEFTIWSAKEASSADRDVVFERVRQVGIDTAPVWVGMSLSADGGTFSYCLDTDMCMLDVCDGNVRFQASDLPAHRHMVISGDSKFVLFCNKDGFLYLVNVEKRLTQDFESVSRPAAHCTRVDSVAFNAEGSEVLSIDIGNNAAVTDARTGHIISSFHLGDFSHGSCVVGGDGNIIAATRDTRLAVFDRRRNAFLFDCHTAHSNQIQEVSVCGSGATVASRGVDHKLRVHAMDGRQIWEMTLPRDSLISSKLIAVNGRTVVFKANCHYQIFENGRLQNSIEVDAEGLISSRVLCSDCDRLVIVDEFGKLHVWSLSGMHKIGAQNLTDVNVATPPLALSRDGNTLVSGGSYRRELNVWDITPRAQLNSLPDVRPVLLTSVSVPADLLCVAHGVHTCTGTEKNFVAAGLKDGQVAIFEVVRY